MFTEKQKYGEGIAIGIDTSKMEKASNILHNFAKRGLSGVDIPYVRFDSMQQFIDFLALWQYSIMSGKHARRGGTCPVKVEKLMPKAVMAAEKIVAGIPDATESFIEGFNIAVEEYETV